MSNALQIKPNQPVGNNPGDVKALLRSFEPQLQNYLRRVDPKVLASAVVNSVRRSPKLLQCSNISMISAVFCCAETGLVPDTPLAECHLIPYGSTVQWIPGYRGLMKLARQSGGITRFDVAIVRDEDEFRVTRGTNPEIVHIPSMGVGTTNRGEMTHVYSVAWFRDGSPPHFEVMDREEIDLIKNEASKNKRSTPWQAHYEEMARKTIVRRHCKYLDLTPQAGLAVDMDNAVASGKDQQFHEAAVGAFETDEPTTQTADELAESLSVNTKTGEVEES